MSHDKASTIENELIVGSALVNPAVLIHDNASTNENVFIGGAKSTKEAKVSQGSIAGGVRADPCLTPRPKIVVVELALVFLIVFSRYIRHHYFFYLPEINCI